MIVVDSSALLAIQPPQHNRGDEQGDLLVALPYRQA